MIKVVLLLCATFAEAVAANPITTTTSAAGGPSLRGCFTPCAAQSCTLLPPLVKIRRPRPLSWASAGLIRVAMKGNYEITDPEQQKRLAAREVVALRRIGSRGTAGIKMGEAQLSGS
jgi:hypothetical protein